MIRDSAQSAFRLYTTYPVQFTLIAAVALPVSLAWYLLASTVLYTLVSFPLLLASLVLHAAQIHAASDAISGRIPSFVRSYRWLVENLSPVVETNLRYLGALTLLFITILGIPFSIRLFVRWFFAPYGVVIANEEPKPAISASCQLINGRWWITAGRLIAPALITSPSVVLVLFVPLLGDVIWSVIFALIISPLFALYFTTVYLEYKGTHAPVGEVLQAHTGSSQI